MLYCVVDQVVLGIRLLAELVWILNSNCLNHNPDLAAIGTRGSLDQLELKIRFSSEAGRTERG